MTQKARNVGPVPVEDDVPEGAESVLIWNMDHTLQVWAAWDDLADSSGILVSTGGVSL